MNIKESRKHRIKMAKVFPPDFQAFPENREVITVTTGFEPATVPRRESSVGLLI